MPKQDPNKLPPNMGWRSWQVKDGWLHSPQQGTRWESPVLQGKCNKDLPFSKCFKDPFHNCGIHSLKETRGLDSYHKPTSVIGTVRHHGTTLEGEHGYRSQNATIDTLWSPNKNTADRLERNYPGVQVIREPHPAYATEYNKEMRYRKRLQDKRAQRGLPAPDNSKNESTLEFLNQVSTGLHDEYDFSRDDDAKIVTERLDETIARLDDGFYDPTDVAKALRGVQKIRAWDYEDSGGDDLLEELNAIKAELKNHRDK